MRVDDVAGTVCQALAAEAARLAMSGEDVRVSMLDAPPFDRSAALRKVGPGRSFPDCLLILYLCTRGCGE